MEFLQQNKIFAAIAGLALLALLVLWPSLFGLGPTIVSLDRARYERAMMDHRSLQGKMDQYLPKSGKGVPIKRAAQEVEASNRLLTQNLDELRSWMAFVPRYPFRIPELRQADEDRKSYVSLAYTYARTGQIKCPEYTIDNYNDGVVFLASQRNIPVRDTFFGMSEMSTPQAIKDPDVRIAQIALVHELGHLAIRLHVDEVASIIPAEPYKVRLHDTDLALAYPVAIRFRCDLPTLLTFLHALDGAHGQVAAVAGGPEAPVAPNKPEADEPAHEAIKPLLPQPKAKADGDEPEDPGPPPAAPAAAKDAPAQQKLVIHLVGSPSYLAPEPNDGALKERFTLFRREEGNPRNSSSSPTPSPPRCWTQATPRSPPPVSSTGAGCAASSRPSQPSASPTSASACGASSPPRPTRPSRRSPRARTPPRPTRPTSSPRSTGCSRPAATSTAPRTSRA
ncbi:MAG TPA: hypothetical protein P5532_06310 [Planctomycetota bacterium]|nr:hypothetical protein [Planctomycetota bacterium]